jgi:predicted phage terminase large subunit-like protein
MSPSPRELFTLALRRDLPGFIHRCFQSVVPGQRYLPSWHIELLADRLERCRHRRSTRLIVCLPPRHLKSLCASVAFPAWLLGHDPGCRIICASYGQELAAKHARDCKAVMDSAWYRHAFPETRPDPAKSGELEFATTARGFRLTCSVGGTLTGRGGNMLIVDDPLKASDGMSEAKRTAVNDWFRGTLYSRLDSKSEDVILVVTQRLHVEDLVGYLLGTGEPWEMLNLPAIATQEERFVLADGTTVGRRLGEALHPAREPLAVLQGIRRALGSYDFSAQYQQEPLPLDGDLIKWAWFRRYDTPPARGAGDPVVQSWDTASKAEEIHDWSVGTTWLRRGQEHYLLDVARVRLDYPALKRRIVAEAERWRPDAVLIEDKGSGTSLLQDLRAEGRVHPLAVQAESDKVTRMYAQSAKLEAGQVLLPRTAPWLDAFQTELLQFPRGRHDDQVDSMAQYLAWRSGRPFRPSDFIVVPSQAAVAWEAAFGPQDDLRTAF